MRSGHLYQHARRMLIFGWWNGYVFTICILSKFMLKPSVTVFGVKKKKKIKVKWGHEGEALIHWDQCPYRKRHQRAHSSLSSWTLRKRPCEDKTKRQLSANQEESTHQKSSHARPLSGTSTSITVRSQFLLFQPRSLWTSIMAALADWVCSNSIPAMWQSLATNLG